MIKQKMWEFSYKIRKGLYNSRMIVASALAPITFGVIWVYFFHLPAYGLVIMLPIFTLYCFPFFFAGHQYDDYPHSLRGVLKANIAVPISLILTWWIYHFLIQILMELSPSHPNRAMAFVIFVSSVFILLPFSLVVIREGLLRIRICAYCHRPAISWIEVNGKPDCLDCEGKGYRRQVKYSYNIKCACLRIACSKCSKKLMLVPLFQTSAPTKKYQRSKSSDGYDDYGSPPPPGPYGRW